LVAGPTLVEHRGKSIENLDPAAAHPTAKSGFSLGQGELAAGCRDPKCVVVERRPEKLRGYTPWACLRDGCGVRRRAK
jgi:hypothetical protein